MLLLRLAWRSFLRHRWRSAITATAISLGLAMMLLFVGIADDGHARMAELGIRMGSGHVVVHDKGYAEALTLDHVISDPKPIVQTAEAVPGVQHVVERVHTSGLLVAGQESVPVLVSGVEPKLEPEVSDIAAAKNRVAGNYLRARSDMQFVNAPADIYLGKKVAEELRVQVGDRVVLTVSPRGESRPASAAFLVRGVFRTGVSELDGGYVEIPLEEAQKLLELNGGVTEVAVLLGGLEQTQPVTRALREQLDTQKLEVLPWQESLRELYEALVLDDAGLYLMMAIIFLIVALGIFNTMLMSVTERTREFGVMMAIGTRPSRLFALIIAESVLLALVSVALGLGLGLLLHVWVAGHGIDVASWAGEMEFSGIAWSGKIYSRLTLGVVVEWTLVIGGIVVASALYPAWRATRLEPVEAMHHV